MPIWPDEMSGTWTLNASFITSFPNPPGVPSELESELFKMAAKNDTQDGTEQCLVVQTLMGKLRFRAPNKYGYR